MRKRFFYFITASLSENAFTLAEVLITLGIIGVVAAMTLPALLTNNRTKVLQTQLKKTYSELEQINQKFLADYGYTMCQFNWNNIDDPTNGTQLMQGTKMLAAAFQKYFTLGKDAKNLGINEITNLAGNAVSATLFDDGSSFDLTKRTYYFEYGSPETKCPIITVDINGYHNKPNRLGIDVFSFRPTKNGKLIPLGNPDLSNDNINGNGIYGACSKNPQSTYDGFGCAYWAIIDQHPQNPDKTYWKDFINMK